MNRRILRSVAAIPLGLAAQCVAYFAVIFAVTIFYREASKPDVPFSLGWLLVTLLMGFVSWIMGGFVTGLVAQRREIAHATGLVLFSLLISVCFPSGFENAKSVPVWYVIAGNVLAVPSILLGGWLSMKQRLLLGAGPAGLVRATDRVRILTAIFVAFGTFVVFLYLTGALAVAGLAPILDRLGTDPVAPVMLPCFLAFLLSVFLARYVFRKIAGERASPPSAGATDSKE